jgi:YD repeat-containing protein
MQASVVARRSVIRIFLALTLCVSVLLVQNASFVLNRAAAQGQNQSSRREGRPTPGKPESNLPDLEEVQHESQLQREPASPIPSVLRSPKVPLQPWNGRRVGDPGTRGELGQAVNRIRRAHAGRHPSAPPSVLDDQFIAVFFNGALLRTPNSTESTFWKDQLRVAYAQGQTSLKLAAVELGKTLFESAEYAARQRDAGQYVTDLYRTFLMREPDNEGWTHWTGQVNGVGRENVRRAFEECPEFAGILASILPNGPATANAASLISARVNPTNQPGNGMLTRDGTWSVPLLSLPGRAGLDLGLGLSYSSAVWTRSGPYIHFDEDNGFPSPGFRLGFPVVQRKVFDAQTAKNSFLFLTAAGRRVELRQVGTSNVYEAGDSSYLQLIDNSPSLAVRSTDGTQLSFVEINNEYSCTQVKDRNGNYITVNHNALGRITTVTDTLGRVINFNYDINQNLISITQSWNGQPSHQWAAFNWDTRTMQSSFSGAAVIGPANTTPLPVVTGMTLNDTSQITFDYNNSLQVYLIRDYFGALQRSETTFTYETPGSDVPRLVDSRISAHNWTGINGVPSQVVTTYSVAGDGACTMTTPDGTVYKQYYGSGWQRGLTTLSEVWSGGVRQKWTTTAWTQDNSSVAYEVNPRVTETNVYDAGGNRRRTVIDYGGYAQWGLPYWIREYAADGVTAIRHTFTDYDLSQAYLDKHIIGLVSALHLKNATDYETKITYSYDDPAWLQTVPAAATQHDAAYSASLTARGNVTAVSRWDVSDLNNASKKLTSYTNYYTTGTPLSTTDAAGHQNTISYTDSFSDNVIRNTFAYPTTITDADNFSSSLQYNFDFGAATRTQSPAPAGQLQGAIQTLTYNNVGQLERVTTTNTGAYKRFWYGADFTASYATVNNVADELYSVQTFDGLGRTLGVAGNHPGSNGQYKAQLNVYDLMGRIKKASNPAEITSGWIPAGDDSTGWLYTQQTYDWQGRPLVTTNPDNTTKEASYAGCGCAGGAAVTLTDEGTLDAGVAKRRQTKIYSDVLGRTVKTEILNWQGGSVYSATINSYNARDQITQVREYAGAEGSGTYQDTTMTYDGYGRVKTKHLPEQNAGTATTWTYNADDTLQKLTDARGASTNYGYNNRHLVTAISYTVPPGSQISVPTAANFSYDAAGNRSTMTDGTGSTNYSYDSLSRLTSESRTFTDLTGSAFSLNYSYNLGNALTVLAIPFRSRQIGYNYDTAGRLSGVTATGFSATYYAWPNQFTQNITTFASNIAYRAWGARKSMTYGNNTSEQTTYNAKLQPSSFTLNNMNYQNTNVCCSYPTYSTMTWNYGYYDDGSLEHAWDSSNEWFDRAYKYDHAARLKEASTFRRARGLSPFPAINYPDPYFQSITYDAFDHSNRTGKLYTGEPSDVGSYVNNRRTGWSYDADGNITSNSSYQQTIDAAGVTARSVSIARVGDGVHYPFQPRLDITQTYDGEGTPAKRVQISRQPGLVDEFGDASEPIEDTQTTYYVKSTVLGGATVAELGWGDTIHIYAGGQRIAREFLGNVTFEHHNPMTGSWATSHGHSSYRTTYREERDPRGAETPLENPYGYAENYVDLRFSQPLFIEGADPFDYASGCTSASMPISCGDAARYVSMGLGIINQIDTAGVNPRRPPDGRRSAFVELVGLIPIQFENGWWYYPSQTDLIELPFINRQDTRWPTVDPEAVAGALETMLATGECGSFVEELINRLGARTNNPFISDYVPDLYKAVRKQGGIVRGGLADNNRVSATVSGHIFKGEKPDGATIYLNSNFEFGSTDPQVQAAAVNALDGFNVLHELIHHAGLNGYYTDRQIAETVSQMTGVPGLPNRKDYKSDTAFVGANSSYFSKVLSQKCPVLPGYAP